MTTYWSCRWQHQSWLLWSHSDIRWHIENCTNNQWVACYMVPRSQTHTRTWIVKLVSTFLKRKKPSDAVLDLWALNHLYHQTVTSIHKRMVQHTRHWSVRDKPLLTYKMADANSSLLPCKLFFHVSTSQH